MTGKPCQAFEHQGSDLRQALTRLETLLNALPHGVEECDLNGLITYSNPAHHRILGYEPGQLIGQSIWDFELTPEASAALRDHLAHLVRDQPEPTPFFTVNRTADNRKVHLRVDWDYKRDGEGLLLGFTAVITDVSESSRTDALLARNEARLAESQRLSQIGNWELDIDNGALWWSDEVYRIFELDPAETSPSYDTFLSTIHPDDRELVNQSYNESVSQKTSYELTHRLQFPGGRIKHVIERGETHYDGQGSPVRSVGSVQDITKRVLAKEALQKSEKRFRDLIEVRGYDRDRQVIFWNASSERLYGYTREEAEGRRLEDLIIPPGMQGRARKTIARHIRNGTAIPATEMVFQHKDGGDVPVYTSHVLLNGKSDAPEMFCIDVDLQDLKRVEAELSYIASFDLVTDLPNRHHLERELTARLNEAGRFDSKAALIFIDLDNFKLINDSLGHDFGDQVLKCVAEKLSSGIRDYDFLARFGGDEFVLLVPEVNSYEDVSGLTQKLLEIFEKPLALEDHEIFITSSIGVAMYPEDGTNCSQLLKSADTAMYQAKESGKNRYRFFSASMNEDMRRQQALTAGLRRALRDDLFELHYQPQIDLGNGRIVSCEALLRWQDPELGYVSPGEFIPVAEKSDLINRIGLWVIERACRDKAEWNRLGVDQLRVDINISGRQFLFGDVLTALHETLERHRLQPADIGIELTENALIEADEQTLMKLESYNKQGCKVAVDDFGTGYSSLSYLKQLPVDIIKIDRSFISGLPEDQGDVAILQAIIAMGHSLNLRVLAEGVETEAQETAVTEKACDLAQGYLYHRPMPAENLLEVLNIRADEKRSPG